MERYFVLAPTILSCCSAQLDILTYCHVGRHPGKACHGRGVSPRLMCESSRLTVYSYSTGMTRRGYSLKGGIDPWVLYMKFHYVMFHLVFASGFESGLAVRYNTYIHTFTDRGLHDQAPWF